MLQIIQKHDMVNSERLEIFVMSVHWGTEVLKKCYGMNKVIQYKPHNDPGGSIIYNIFKLQM